MISDDVLKKLNNIIQNSLFETCSKLATCVEQELNVPRSSIKVEYINGAHEIYIKFPDGIRDITIRIDFEEENDRI